MLLGIPVGDITWAGLLEGFVGVLAAGLITIAVAWRVYVHERNDRRRDRLHEAMVALLSLAWDHRKSEVDWDERTPETTQALLEQSVRTVLDFRHQLQVAISLSRNVDKELHKELVVSLAASIDFDQPFEAADVAVKLIERWLLGQDPDTWRADARTTPKREPQVDRDAQP